MAKQALRSVATAPKRSRGRAGNGRPDGQRDEVRQFLQAMSTELAALAASNGLGALATLFDLAAAAAADIDPVTGHTPSP